ncbi:hypothetical protein [Microbacterium sp.]|uniref:hypothetical protein n=1 Tax=Microbacterium sp. TaxID=51671 RepID=UPI003A882740
MTLSSVLVAGTGLGLSAAVALARGGAEVAIVAPATAREAVDDLADLSALGIEVRLGVALVGVLDVDSHVEAELSNGRVENYDAVLIADGPTAVRVGADAADSHRVGRIDDAADVDRWVGRLSRPRARDAG